MNYKSTNEFEGILPENNSMCPLRKFFNFLKRGKKRKRGKRKGKERGQGKNIRKD